MGALDELLARLGAEEQNAAVEAADKEDDIREAAKAAVAEVDGEIMNQVVARLNREWAVVAEGGKTMIVRERTDPETGVTGFEFFTREHFRALFEHETVLLDGRRRSVADVWLKHPARRVYSGGMALLPDAKAPDGVLNLWRGWGVEPVQATVKDVAPFVEFLFDVICNRSRAVGDYLMRWLAWSVQNPGRQAEVAVLLQGGQGTGKGTLGRLFISLFGAHGLHIFQRRHLVGHFNSHLRSTCALFVDEALFVGDREGQNILKALVTEPEIAIEAKGRDVIVARNRLKIIAATNEEHVLHAATDERRWLVVRTSDLRKGDLAYFEKLNAWLDNGGRSKVLGYLRTLPLAGFNIRRVPGTEALKDQKLRSLDNFGRWLLQRLERGDWPEEIAGKALIASFETYLKDRGVARYDTTSHKDLIHRLRRYGIEVESKERRADDGQGRGRIWRLPPLQVARAGFARALGMSLEDVFDDTAA